MFADSASVIARSVLAIYLLSGCGPQSSGEGLEPPRPGESKSGDSRPGDSKPKLVLDLPSAHKSTVQGVAFSPDGAFLASASASNSSNVKLWDVAAGTEKADLKGHDKDVSAVAFGPDGKTLVSAGWDVTVRLWDVGAGKKKSAPKGFGEGGMSSYLCMALSPDGKTAAAAGFDKEILLWNVETGKRTTLKGHASQVHALAFSADGKVLVSGSADGTYKLWDPAGGKAKATFDDKVEGACLASAPTARRWRRGARRATSSCGTWPGARSRGP